MSGSGRTITWRVSDLATLSTPRAPGLGSSAAKPAAHGLERFLSRPPHILYSLEPAADCRRASSFRGVALTGDSHSPVHPGHNLTTRSAFCQHSELLKWARPRPSGDASQAGACTGAENRRPVPPKGLPSGNVDDSSHHLGKIYGPLRSDRRTSSDRSKSCGMRSRRFGGSAWMVQRQFPCRPAA